jgi:hypothetical protein
MGKKNRAARRRAAAAKGNAPAAAALADRTEAPPNLWTRFSKWVKPVWAVVAGAITIVGLLFTYEGSPKVEMTPTIEANPSGHYFITLVNGGDAAADQMAMTCMALPTGFRDYLQEIKSVGNAPPVEKGLRLTKNVRARYPVSKCVSYHYGKKEENWSEPFGYVMVRVCYKAPIYQWDAGDDVAAFKYDSSINAYVSLQVDQDHSAKLFRDSTTQYCKHVFTDGKSVG